MDKSPSPDQIRLIQATWAHIVPLAYTFSNTFYDRLFAIDPSTRILFANRERIEQSSKFLQMLSLMVRELPNVERLEADLGNLGKRHSRYGVSPQHYDSMADALLWTLELMLGSKYSSTVEEAWLAGYRTWVAIMRRNGSSAAPPTEMPGRPDMVSPPPSA